MEPTSIDTLCARGGEAQDLVTGAVVPAIQPATTFARGPDSRLYGAASYARDEDPTVLPAERLLARLEGGAACALFASGMAAATAVFQALEPGAHVVAQSVMYWGLRGWLTDFTRWGIEVDFVEPGDPAAWARAIVPGRTRVVWIETPANPTWDVVDVRAVADLAHAAGAVVAVDSTVATPVLTRPLALGADLVMHAGTKYLNGHSDVVCGALVTAREDALWARIRTVRHDGGAVLGPFGAWLLLRGMRTLPLRVRQQCRTALALARALDGHPRLEAVLYPGLAGHPGHEVARAQMDGGFGGMLSIRVRGGAPAALAAAGRMNLFIRATSLGGAESLVEHRASVEPPSSPVPPDLLRLSIGLESEEELLADLVQALEP